MVKRRMKVDWPCPDCPGFAEELEGEADEGCERGEAEAKTHLIMVDQLAWVLETVCYTKVLAIIV